MDPSETVRMDLAPPMGAWHVRRHMDAAHETTHAASVHARWVRLTHWLAAASVMALAFSGVEILMVHPRLYWGEAGNDLTPPLLELSISRNHRHGGWTTPTPFVDGPGAAVSAGRTFEIFNQNGWGRSLHFLAAWVLVAVGLAYALAGVIAGHFRRHLLGGREALSVGALWHDLRQHLRGVVPLPTGGPDYGPLQRTSYLVVIFLVAPLLVLTGLTMSPAVAAAAPRLLDLFGGHQSARTLHFAAFGALMLFVVAHVVMVMRSGLGRRVRAMTVGDRP
jgi:thiosulfate reductase cytochrome b subunit